MSLTFTENSRANGGAVSGLGASIHVFNSLITNNAATVTLTIRTSQIIDTSDENFLTAPYRDIFSVGGRLTVTGSTVQ